MNSDNTSLQDNDNDDSTEHRIENAPTARSEAGRVGRAWSGVTDRARRHPRALAAGTGVAGLVAGGLLTAALIGGSAPPRVSTVTTPLAQTSITAAQGAAPGLTDPRVAPPAQPCAGPGPHGPGRGPKGHPRGPGRDARPGPGGPGAPPLPPPAAGGPAGPGPNQPAPVPGAPAPAPGQPAPGGPDR